MSPLPLWHFRHVSPSARTIFSVMTSWIAMTSTRVPQVLSARGSSRWWSGQNGQCSSIAPSLLGNGNGGASRTWIGSRLEGRNCAEWGFLLLICSPYLLYHFTSSAASVRATSWTGRPSGQRRTSRRAGRCARACPGRRSWRWRSPYALPNPFRRDAKCVSP